MTPEQRVLSRIRTRSIAIAAISASIAFLVSWQAGLSLTIPAGVVILSFLVLERLTERLVPPQEKRGWKALLPILLVTVAGLILLGLVLGWEAFEPLAGFVGLSVVVLAIGAEIFQGTGGG